MLVVDLDVFATQQNEGNAGISQADRTALAGNLTNVTELVSGGVGV